MKTKKNKINVKILIASLTISALVVVPLILTFAPSVIEDKLVIENSNKENVGEGNSESPVVTTNDTLINEKPYSDIETEGIKSDESLIVSIKNVKKDIPTNPDKAYLDLNKSLSLYDGNSREEALIIYNDLSKYIVMKNTPKEKHLKLVQSMNDPLVFFMGVLSLEEDDMYELPLDDLSSIIPFKGSEFISLKKMEFNFEQIKNGELGLYSDIFNEFNDPIVEVTEDNFEIYEGISLLEKDEDEALFTSYIVKFEGKSFLYGSYYKNDGINAFEIKTKEKMKY